MRLISRLSAFTLALLIASSAFALKPRIVFEKYLFAEGVNPKARYLDRLMVKFLDEDMVRLRDGKVVSTNGRNSLAYTQNFLERHPEIQPEIIIRSMTEEEFAAMIAENERKSGVDLVDLFSFFRFRLPEASTNPKELLADILNAPEVEVAYYEGIAKDMLCTDIGDVTPDYTGNQDYHDAAPTGTDLDFARSAFNPDDVDGNSTWWAGIIEVGFTLGHEDLSNPQLGFSGSYDAGRNHGAGVTGIIGACDDNGVGCLGFAADWSMYLFARGSDAYSSIADCITDANNDLIEGEVVNHSWGYTANPMPAGQTCPCNPNQNGSVACEYEPSVQAAIQVGTAEGIHHHCSAGNGCVDLDDPVFGSTFDINVIDTWSTYVSAINSWLNGDGHDAACYTSYGSRVTVNAFGNNVTTHGYARLWPTDSTDGNINEWYTDKFNGTSSAAPIVSGAAAVVQYLWWLKWSNTYLHPQTLRSLLDFQGTDPIVTPGNIGVMPDLFGILGPNLEPHWQAAGWDYTVVPRNTNDATFDNVTLPATLNSAPTATYMNWNVINESLFKEAEPANFGVFVDDVLEMTCMNASLNYATWDRCLNQSIQIRGGRHTLRNMSDPLDELAESDESFDHNNRVHTFVWNPRELSNAALALSHPPDGFVTGQTSPDRNQDGYRNTSPGQWRISALICDDTGTDYDIRIYDEVPTSTFGYDTWEASGSLLTDLVDLVGRNRNTQAGEDLIGVINTFNTATADYSVHSVGSIYVGTPGPGRNLVASDTIDNAEVCYAVEFFVNELVSYTVELDHYSFSSKIVGELYEPSLGYFHGGDQSEYFANAGPGGGWIYHFVPTQIGRHCIVLHKYDADDWNAKAAFNLYLGKSLPDLTHALAEGWSHRIIVTQATMSPPPVLPATLTGNTTTNYLHAAYTNIGGIANPPLVMNDRFFRDGLILWTTGEWWTWNPGDTTWWTNQGPVWVYGGRHTITDVIDIHEEQDEWREDNNRWDEQFVWRAFTMNPGTVYLGSGPAPNGRDNDAVQFFVDDNCDGWAWRGDQRWTGAAMCGIFAGDWYDMTLFENATSSTEGFEESWIGSQASTGKLQFVVIDERTDSLEGIHEVGIYNQNDLPDFPSSARYYMQAENATIILNDGCNGTFTLLGAVGGNDPELFHIYEVDLTSGEDYAIALDNLSTANLNIGVYPPDPPLGSRSWSGENAEENGPGGDESVQFMASTTGTYAVVVYRDSTSDLGPQADYNINIGPRTPIAPTGLVIRVLDNLVDPIEMKVWWDPVTVDTNGCPVEVDEYHVYLNVTPNDVWGVGFWTEIGTTVNTELEFSVDAAIEYFKMVVIAEDIDGLIVAPPEGTDAIARQ